jgi:hypothetical protein
VSLALESGDDLLLEDGDLLALELEPGEPTGVSTTFTLGTLVPLRSVLLRGRVIHVSTGVLGTLGGIGVAAATAMQRYVPNPPPVDQVQAAAWIQREIDKIARVFALAADAIDDLKSRVEDLED